MKIATFANARTAVEARKGIAPAFMCAFRSGAVMGFLLSGLGLLVLFITIIIFKQVRSLINSFKDGSVRRHQTAG